MSRFATKIVRSLSVLLGLATLAAAQDLPALEPPTLEAPRAAGSRMPRPEAGGPASQPDRANPKPAGSAPPGARAPGLVRPAAPKPEVRPMLAIPGVTAPAPRSSPASRPQVAGPIQPGEAALSPTLDALPPSSEMPGVRLPATSSRRPASGRAPSPFDDLPSLSDLAAPGRTASGSAPARPAPRGDHPFVESIPLTIEPLDDDPRRNGTPPGRSATSGPANARGTAGTRTTNSRPDDAPDRLPPEPRRNPSFLGRLLGIPPAPLPPPRQESRSTSRAERESDLSPDEVARRRIERQVRATVGDKVRSFDVRVTGRNVDIVAQPSRFWYRRTVRRSLETLPVLQGYRARVEVTE